jgi:hypothetical protein
MIRSENSLALKPISNSVRSDEFFCGRCYYSLNSKKDIEHCDVMRVDDPS